MLVRFNAGADMKRNSSLQIGNSSFENVATVVEVLPNWSLQYS